MYQIDFTSKTPIYEQLYKKIIELIMKGALSEGDQLPSVRALAKELAVNPNTIQKAIKALEQEGIIYSVTGRGSFIAPVQDSNTRMKAKEQFIKEINEAIRLGFEKEELIQIIKELNV